MANSLKSKSEEKALATLTEWERLTAFKQDFLADWRADSEFRKHAEKAGRYYDGDQWTDEEKQALEARKQPVTVNNRIKANIDGLYGLQAGNSVDTKIYPAGSREQEVEILSERIRQVEDRCSFDDQESEATLDILIEGRAWYSVKKRWDGLRAYSKIEREPIFDWVKDRDSNKEDLSDAHRVHHTVWVRVEELKEMFPAKAKEIEKFSMNDDSLSLEDMMKSRRIRPDQYKDLGTPETLSDTGYSEFCDEKNRKVRVVTTYYRTRTPLRFYYHPKLSEPQDVTKASKKDIEILLQSFPEGQFIREVKLKLNSYTFTWNVELEFLTDIRPYDDEADFPVVMMNPYKTRKDGIHYGKVKEYEDQQDSINKRESKMLHQISVNQVRFIDGAFDNEHEARQQFQLPDGWIKMKRPDQVTVLNNLDVSQAQFQLLQQALSNINATAAPEVKGQTSANSGVEVDKRVALAQTPNRRIPACIRSGRQRAFRNALKDELPALNEELAASGQPVLPLTKYDVVVSEVPDTVNARQEISMLLNTMAANKYPIPPDLLIEFSEAPRELKDKLIQGLQQAIAASAPQGASGGNQMPVQ